MKNDDDNRLIKSPIISSSKFLKTNGLTKAFAENSEFEYWKEKKLKPSKVEVWMNELSISEEDMIESLCHKR